MVEVEVESFFVLKVGVKVVLKFECVLFLMMFYVIWIFCSVRGLGRKLRWYRCRLVWVGVVWKLLYLCCFVGLGRRVFFVFFWIVVLCFGFELWVVVGRLCLGLVWGRLYVFRSVW